MRNAIDINLQETEEYKALEKFFGAKGTPAYKIGTSVADNDTKDGKDSFEFTLHYGRDTYYSDELARNIQNMVKALVAKIKEQTIA